MSQVIPFDDIAFSATAKLFEGGDQVPVSIFVTEYERGRGVALHLHPYPEVFVVLTGTGLFTVGDEKLTVEARNVVVVPAETPHGFEGAGDDVLQVVSVHPCPAVQQTDL